MMEGAGRDITRSFAMETHRYNSSCEGISRFAWAGLSQAMSSNVDPVQFFVVPCIGINFI